jgi:hypothetical protein
MNALSGEVPSVTLRQRGAGVKNGSTFLDLSAPRKFLPLPQLTRSKFFEVVPEETARHKKQPHFLSKLFVVLPAVVNHPKRRTADKEKVAYRNATTDGVVL